MNNPTQRRPGGQLDPKRVKAAAEGRIREVLLALIPGLTAEHLDGRHHPCPSCGGTDRFRLLDENVGALYCNQCHADHNGDLFAAIQHFRGCKFTEAVRLVADYLGIQAEASPRKSKADAADAKNSPTFANIEAVVRHLIRACTPRGSAA